MSRWVATPSSSTQAGLDERLERQQLDELVDVGVAVAGQVRLAVGVEALAAGLGAELALGDERLMPSGT